VWGLCLKIIHNKNNVSLFTKILCKHASKVKVFQIYFDIFLLHIEYLLDDDDNEDGDY